MAHSATRSRFHELRPCLGAASSRTGAFGFPGADARSCWTRSIRRGGAETTVSELATDMVALLDTLGIDRVPVCGLSLGGMIAQQIAVDHPDRISAMLVANSRAENAGMRPARKVEGWITEFEGKGGPLARLEKTYPILVNESFRSSPAGEATLELWRLVLSRVTGHSLANVARGMVKFDVTGTLPNLQIPTLVVSGPEDKLIPPALSRRTAELVQGATFEVIPGAGHISSMDSTVAFNHVLLRFLSGVEGGRWAS